MGPNSLLLLLACDCAGCRFLLPHCSFDFHDTAPLSLLFLAFLFFPGSSPQSSQLWMVPNTPPLCMHGDGSSASPPPAIISPVRLSIQLSGDTFISTWPESISLSPKTTSTPQLSHFRQRLETVRIIAANPRVLTLTWDLGPQPGWHDLIFPAPRLSPLDRDTWSLPPCASVSRWSLNCAPSFFLSSLMLPPCMADQVPCSSPAAIPARAVFPQALALSSLPCSRTCNSSLLLFTPSPNGPTRLLRSSANSLFLLDNSFFFSFSKYQSINLGMPGAVPALKIPW